MLPLINSCSGVILYSAAVRVCNQLSLIGSCDFGQQCSNLPQTWMPAVIASTSEWIVSMFRVTGCHRHPVRAMTTRLTRRLAGRATGGRHTVAALTRRSQTMTTSRRYQPTVRVEHLLIVCAHVHPDSAYGVRDVMWCCVLQPVVIF